MSGGSPWLCARPLQISEERAARRDGRSCENLWALSAPSESNQLFFQSPYGVKREKRIMGLWRQTADAPFCTLVFTSMVVQYRVLHSF